MKNTCYYDMGFVKIGLTEENGAITQLIFATKEEAAVGAKTETPLLRGAVLQLEQYLAGRRKEFFLPLDPHGTEFMHRVWDALETIPYGETRSYKQIASQIGHNRAYRAVGLANNRNPIPIIIPCHRVIGHNGKLVGYGGGLPVKERLLQLEQRYSMEQGKADHACTD
ncbi:MAG: methylated-DNA--[protein]-cysteine S-methyltransferase [Clostridiales bacterium]|nr:methylated-DNA--[protein]-cysteine S-methyltransferase [Clostridiales bacterium]